MIFLNRFSLLIFLFLSFSFYAKASASSEEADLLLDFASFSSASISHNVNKENKFDGIQGILNAAGSDLVLDTTSISIHTVTSFHEAQPYIDTLKAGDIWLSDVDETLIDNNFELMESGIVERLEGAKKRKVSVLALTSAKHPNEYKEEILKRRRIIFSTNFSHLSHYEGFSTLNKGILCSKGMGKKKGKGRGKGVTAKRFLKSAFSIQETKLRNQKKVFRAVNTPPAKVLVMDNLEENLFDIREVLQDLLTEPPFTEMKVTLLHYVPPSGFLTQ
ncbi:MAG: hypothetical protein K2W94_04440 [Alphaproteobacteria bacterium]|nr:hypothetical protein [Alphaproteobacteria bacterium]